MITCSATFIRCGQRGPKLEGIGTGRNTQAAFARAARQAGLYVRRYGAGWRVNTMPDQSGTPLEIHCTRYLWREGAGYKCSANPPQ